MFVYTIQPVVKRFDNRFDNRLYRLNGASRFLLLFTNSLRIRTITLYTMIVNFRLALINRPILVDRLIKVTP